ncbi:MAG: zinc ABC transporter substrate-binding protein, partial [Patescibacteria group bacterium]|nr:zinc ABC transporter substrate-binding protein [Patescibacteria group bacterium]
CKIKDVVYGGHYAFGYLTKRYGLNYVAAQGIAPDSEPTANDMVNLVKQIKKNGIKYIFYEELTSPKISETLAKETGTQMLLLNAAHNVTKQDLNNGVSYLSIMRENLANLKVGLECQ